MTQALETRPDRSAKRIELMPEYFDPALIVTPEGNPVRSKQEQEELTGNIRERGQQSPGWVCPASELGEGKFLCLEGNGRLHAVRSLGLEFWAFNCGRPVPEAERIRLTCSHNLIRRRMGNDELVGLAERFIELERCTAGDAARLLNISGPTLSRAFGEKRIPPEMRPKIDGLGLSIRSLIAAAPPAFMAEAVEFATTPGDDGRLPTRDQVAEFIRVRKSGLAKPPKAKLIPLRIGDRIVTLTHGEADTAATVLKDLQAIIARLTKHADVKLEGWQFLFL